MFYNQDYLLSKQAAGLHLAWLASTMSNTTATAFKKISKREIVSFDVRKTCNEVARPAQPLALRTSGILMYGVVRVYNKQTDFWAHDVQGAYNAIRKAILQSPHGVVQTIGGIAVVGQDTGAIDLPNRGKHTHETVTAPCLSELHRHGFSISVDWLELTEDQISSQIGDFSNTISDSLSMFGSSLYEQSLGRAREGSFDHGLGIFTPQHQPYTAEPNTIMRPGEITPLGHQTDLGMLGLDDLDLPQALQDGIQLDLGQDLDMTTTGAGGFDLNALGDDTGFDIPMEDGFPQAQDQNAPQHNEDERPAKRPRLAVADRSLELSFARIENIGENYAEKMAILRAKERKRQLIKEAQQLARTNIFGPGIVFSGSNVLTQLWTTCMDARLAQLGSLASPTEYQEGLDGNLNDHFGQGEQVPFQADNGEMPFFDGDQSGFPDQTLDNNANDWDVEIGRAGMDSQPIEMPWARRSTILPGIDDTTLAGETTLGINTRSFDIETPSGIRRISRRSDLSHGTPDHRRTTLNAGDAGIAAAEGFQLGGEEGEAQEQLSSQAMAEQENVQFLDYVSAIRAGLKEDDMLMFSDLAPVSDAQPAIAARAFYQVLSLVTARKLSAKQDVPYGEIVLKVV
ncbi:uncharacterized protein FA14DRAFT_181427 [Meira miltonrushii]|uniref:Rad21/Rec8-like protein N-terminal domain-containing protein n=1 Tax=Meira miltonrushii TaxID=1280837 RepID=A0A316V6T5_9BASI|nr:uncharacterized protein FA14DRAFT_181427 [Meira miltonrushii]PWN32748.1 hypothetical protein FA14DRAFT_181427 [Meira miltonrushii]